jgi:hypothetical protein
LHPGGRAVDYDVHGLIRGFGSRDGLPQATRTVGVTRPACGTRRCRAGQAARLRRLASAARAAFHTRGSTIRQSPACSHSSRRIRPPGSPRAGRTWIRVFGSSERKGDLVCPDCLGGAATKIGLRRPRRTSVSRVCNLFTPCPAPQCLRATASGCRFCKPTVGAPMPASTGARGGLSLRGWRRRDGPAGV